VSVFCGKQTRCAITTNSLVTKRLSNELSQIMTNTIQISIDASTASRLDRARTELNCSPSATYAATIDALLDEAEVEPWGEQR
jgi:molybdenum cofactor biosynthesis enzyme MoaA